MFDRYLRKREELLTISPQSRSNLFEKRECKIMWVALANCRKRKIDYHREFFPQFVPLIPSPMFVKFEQNLC